MSSAVSSAHPRWQPDSATSACRACKTQFTVTLRRHHCRFCGFIFCKRCCRERCIVVPYHPLFRGTPQRRCLLCRKREGKTAALMLEEAEQRAAVLHEFSNGEFFDGYSFRLRLALSCAERVSRDQVAMQTQMRAVAAAAASPTADAASASAAGHSPEAVSRPASGGCGADRCATPDDLVRNAANMSFDFSRRATLSLDKDAGPPAGIALADAHADPSLVRAALAFHRAVQEAGLVRDRRLGLRPVKAAFDRREAEEAFVRCCLSVHFDLLFDVLTRAGFCEGLSEQLFRFDPKVVDDFRANASVDAPAPLAAPCLHVGAVVCLASDPLAEACVVSVGGGGSSDVESVVLLSPDAAERASPAEAVVASPFRTAGVSLARYTKGTAVDMSGKTVPLGEVDWDFLRASLLFVKHAQHMLIREATAADGTTTLADVFDGAAAAQWLAKACGLERADTALHAGELLRSIGFIEDADAANGGGGGSDTHFFEGLESQLYTVRHGLEKQLEDAAALRAAATSPGSGAPCANPFTVGSTVVAAGLGAFRRCEGLVVGLLEGDHLQVQFHKDGTTQNWVMHREELEVSPAVEALSCLHQVGTLPSVTQPGIERFANVFVDAMAPLLKEQRQGFTYYKSVFSTDEAIAEIEASFPSLGRHDAASLFNILAEAGLFETVDGEPISFGKKHLCRFVSLSIRSLKRRVPERLAIRTADAGRAFTDAIDRGTILAGDLPLGWGEALSPMDGGGAPAGSRHSVDYRSKRGSGVHSLSLFGGDEGRSRRGSILSSAASAGYEQECEMEGLVLRKVDGFAGRKWNVQYMRLTADGLIERHAPKVQVVSSGRLRTSPHDNNFDLRDAVGEYTDVQDQLVLVSGVVTGFYKVRRGDKEGWVKTSAVVPVLAEQSALKASGMTCEVGDELPGKLDVEEGELWEYGMVLRNGHKIQHLCVQSEDERNRWMTLLARA
eukprot:Rhum_TRINITY_DN18615_c0_g1::Rhum_TRINITY_DN18615_c0_g1_i1::g.167898::m.167898